MSDGLSQEDFRKLMATPRRPNNDGSSQQQAKFKIPAPKTPRNTGSVFAKPESVKRKNRFKKAAKKQDDDDEEEEEEESVSQYRDRAAERRKQETNEEEEDESQLTTEELLQRTRAEKGEELDAKQLYTQSKYLGGDVEHTHLVKGLDFALLKQVRTDLENKKQQESDDEEEEEEEEEAMDVDEAEQVEQEKKPVFHTLLAKNIVDLFEKQESTLRNELFEPGRMAFAFELADQVGHYSEPFAIPTAVIRSKGEVISRLSKSGWSEDAQSESNLVIDKITQVMAGVRRGDRGISQQPTQKEKKQSKKLIVEPAAAVAVTDDGFMGDIFEDAGREYELSEDVESTTAATSNASKGNYFQGLVKEDDQEDQEMEAVTDEAVTALLAKASKSNIESEPGDEQQEKQPESKKRKYDMTVDADAADIDMFGLSTSALPTSFEDHQTNTTAYQSDDDDQEDKGVQFVDQGTHRNKKAQLTRWDFDNEEEYQKYKDSVEIHPKSAFQFGVKLGDGRKRNRERKGMDEKQRLNRDYQQVKSIMEKKYGQNL